MNLRCARLFGLYAGHPVTITYIDCHPWRNFPQTATDNESIMSLELDTVLNAMRDDNYFLVDG